MTPPISDISNLFGANFADSAVCRDDGYNPSVLVDPKKFLVLKKYAAVSAAFFRVIIFCCSYPTDSGLAAQLEVQEQQDLE